MNAPTGDSFLLMTHNAGNGLARPPKLAQVLRDSGADIIALQEITVAQAEALDTMLGDVYPYRVLYGEGIPGKGILSRFPIVETRRLRLFPDRPDLWGELDIGGRRLELVSGHPWPPRAHRNGYYQGPETREHIRQLLAHAMSGRPAIVMGDFNFTDKNSAYAEFAAAGLTDAFRVAGKGRGATLPASLAGIAFSPMLRIDYILHTTHFKAEEAWVGSNTGSDHLPVLARLRWPICDETQSEQESL